MVPQNLEKSYGSPPLEDELSGFFRVRDHADQIRRQPNLCVVKQMLKIKLHLFPYFGPFARIFVKHHWRHSLCKCEQLAPADPNQKTGKAMHSATDLQRL
jgi:hypothetical protein